MSRPPESALGHVAQQLTWPDGRTRIRGALRAGPLGSALIHGMAALLLLYRVTVPDTPRLLIPVDVVFLEQQETAPPERQNAPGPQTPGAPQRMSLAPQKRAARPSATTELASLMPPVAKPTEPAPDALQSKLDALAKLRAPATDPRLRDGGLAGTKEGGAEDGPGAYSVKDYVRAQVERRWNLDLAELGSRNYVIAIRVLLHRDGTIDKAEIVDQTRFASDTVFHSIALSARNAVLLSSPLALPAGNYDELMDMVVTLNPRDTLR